MKPYMLSDKVWKKAIVTKRLDDRLYEISSEDENICRRGRAHLKEGNMSYDHLKIIQGNSKKLNLTVQRRYARRL
ncbi:hypothetical protein LSH36_589g03002 [Paralvinella palmiformis]|uniref:Uncharacterized protein n=1 Tax=Paralvinella palmiformis TaxID=53620 RepID=A0AAD9MWT3_9ANNE|nr:hypothetical protein LSH36_589g03002 [Paralvinella palmiformis]